MLHHLLKLAHIYNVIARFPTIHDNLVQKYSWLMPVFEMFFAHNKERDDNLIKEWLEHNQFEIESILSNFPDPKFIGKGNNGVAYLVGDSKDQVLKFVTEFDYDRAVEIQNKLYSGEEGAEYLPNIYHYGSFEAPSEKHPDIYYVIMEKAVVRPISMNIENERIESSVHNDYRDFRKIMEKYIFSMLDTNMALDQMTRAVYNKIIIEIDHEALDRIVNFLGNGDYQWLLEIIKSSIIQMQQGYYDLHWQNFGQRHNQPTKPVVFDA